MRRNSRGVSPRGDFIPVGHLISGYTSLIMGKIRKNRLQKTTESELSDSSKSSCGSHGGRVRKRTKKFRKPKARRVKLKEGVACLGDQSCDASPVSAVESSKALTSESSTAQPFVSMDCEMVAAGNRSVLAKCSILGYDGQVLYNEYVRPDKPISDYRTKWSGIKPHHMRGAQPFRKAVQQIKHTLEGSIIIGHDLVHDFGVIGLRHPRTCVRDTAKFVPLRRLAGLTHNLSPSLKNLTANLLGRTIQSGSHCSLEDARAALDIYRKYEGAWEEHLLDNTFWLQDQFWPEDVCCPC